MAVGIKRTREEVCEIVENLEYSLLNQYIRKNIRRVVIQDAEGYKYDVELNSLIRGHTPPIAETRSPFALSNISLWLKIENKSFILCDGNVYQGNRKKLLFQCLRENCQEVFDMSWDMIYSMGCECPFCGGDRVGKRNNLAILRPELVAEWDYEKNKNNPEYYTEKCGDKVSWICSKCGNPWDAQISNRSNGSGCPKCNDLQKESTIANEIKRYFESNYNAIPEYQILRNPKTGYWLPYDIYIPHGDNPELNGFYIEIHGSHHYNCNGFHQLLAKKNNTTPEEEFEYQKYKDKIKKKFAKKNGVYIEIDLRKIKTTEEAIKYIEKITK